MRHPGEQIIERIAKALIDLHPGVGWDRNSMVPAELADSFRHVRECAYCREVLEVLIHTEVRWRDGAIPDVRAIPLRARWTAPASIEDEDVDENGHLFHPVVAADTPQVPDQTRMLTLITDDDRFLVRIFPDEEGDGAKAVLVFAAQGPPQPQEVRPALRVSGIDYEFDEEGIARLPQFPGADVALVLR
jgi:hypothetical protein